MECKKAAVEQIPIARPFFDQAEIDAVTEVLKSGWVTQGPKVQAFEEQFARYVGSTYAVAVSSCTTALHLSLVVSNIGPGDEVICPSLSFIATANAIVHAGATPVFADVDPLTYNITQESVLPLITSKTRAIILVHQMGLPADIDRFLILCHEKKLKLIEDAACAVGSSYKGRKIGSHSELVCFSFHPRKVVATGDGGMITTSNPALFERLKLLRQHGMSVNDRDRHLARKIISEEYLEIGYNYRMTDLQAAIGICQLNKLDSIVAERRRIAGAYQKALHGLKNIRLPFEPEECRTNFQSFPIFLNKNSGIERDELMQLLLDVGIATRRGIMTAHREKAYLGRCGTIRLPESESASDHSFLLPLFVPMADGIVQRVVDGLVSILKK